MDQKNTKSVKKGYDPQGAGIDKLAEEAEPVITVDDADGVDTVDTLGLRETDEANLGGAMPDSTSVAMSGITTPHIPHPNPAATPTSRSAATTSEEQDVLRATENSLRDTVGAFAVAGIGSNGDAATPSNSNSAGPSNSNSESGPHLPANIDIIAEATLVEPEPNETGPSGVDASSVTRDVTIESATTAVAVSSGGDAEAPPHEASVNTTNAAPSGDDREEPVQAQIIDKYTIFACGRHLNIKRWHLAMLGILVVGAIVAIPLGVVYGGNGNNKDEEPTSNAEAQDAEAAEEPEPFTIPLELPPGVVLPECEFQLYENDSTFQVESLILDGVPVPPPGEGARQRAVVARPGSRLQINGAGSSCARSFCPGCLAQLYVTLMDYDDGNIYDPCQYVYSGQAVGDYLSEVHDYPDIVRPDPELTTKCLYSDTNGQCVLTDYKDLVLYFPDKGEATDATESRLRQLHPASMGGHPHEYVLAMTSSYEYLCQEELKYNRLRILRVSDEYLFRIEGEPIEHTREEIEEEVSLECAYQTREDSNVTFAIFDLYLNDAAVPIGSTVSAVPGDKIRVTGNATTCSPNWNGDFWAQLHVSIIGTDDGAIYDPCKYKHAGHEVLYEKEPSNLLRPPVESTSHCFYNEDNESCELKSFDEEFVVENGAANATGGVGGEYRVVLAHTSEYYCQEEMAENNLEILHVSEDYVLEVEGDRVVNMPKVVLH